MVVVLVIDHLLAPLAEQQLLQVLQLIQMVPLIVSQDFLAAAQVQPIPTVDLVAEVRAVTAVMVVPVHLPLHLLLYLAVVV
jgi:hypothetical protein